LFGAINIIIRNDFSGNEVSYRAGENNFHNVEYTGGFSFDKHKMLLNFTYLDTDGVDIDQLEFIFICKIMF